MSNSEISRRKFLEAGAAVVGATWGLSASGSYAQAAGGSDLAEVFKGIQLKDQYGEIFDPATVFADKTALIQFGYGGCPVCNEMNKTSAVTQQKLIDAKYEVPQLLISVLPDRDARGEEDTVQNLFGNGTDLLYPSQLEGVVGEIEAKRAADKGESPRPAREIIGDISGVGGTNFERRDRLNSEFDVFKHIGEMEGSQRKRAFTFAMPATQADAQELQRRLSRYTGKDPGLLAGKPEQHSRYLTLVHNGKVQGAYKAADVDRRTGNFEASDELVEKTSGDILTKVQSLGTERLR